MQHRICRGIMKNACLEPCQMLGNERILMPFWAAAPTAAQCRMAGQTCLRCNLTSPDISKMLHLASPGHSWLASLQMGIMSKRIGLRFLLASRVRNLGVAGVNSTLGICERWMPRQACRKETAHAGSQQLWLHDQPWPHHPRPAAELLSEPAAAPAPSASP